MSVQNRIGVAIAGLCITVATSPAFALAQRTFVASYGNDAQPCSLALPCRGFAAAIAATLPGGEVIVKDSAGYGTVTIAQSVSIVAPAGVYAGITIPGLGTGVTVNAPGGKVLLRGLTINGQTSGQYGIWLQNGAELVVDRCAIANVKDAGVFVTAPGSALTMTDTLVRYTLAGPGIRLNSDVRAALERVRILRSVANLGIFADTSASVSIKDSLIAANFGGAVVVTALAGATASLSITDSVLSDNRADAVKLTTQILAGTMAKGSVTGSMITRSFSGQGIIVSSNPPANASMSASGNLVSQNGNGMGTAGSGQLLSARDNTFSRNTQFALTGNAGSPLHTVKGADGLPSNAGEQATPTSGTVTPVNPF
ncbi:MAG: right-handed parallel beta-helix repeat-containing protein [Casimicrobiaceae bacterium]